MPHIRRSRQITLGLLATVSIVLLAGCGENVEDRTVNEFYRKHNIAENEETKVFRDQAECQQTRSADDCLEAMQTAETEHVRSAPQFSGREACEREYGEGACQQLTDRQVRSGPSYGASSHPASNPFIPMMQGYILGSMMSSGGRSAAPVYYGREQSCASNSRAPGCNGSTSGISARPVYSGPIVIGRAPSAGSVSSAPSVVPRVGGGSSSWGSSSTVTRAPAPASVSIGKSGGFGSIGSGFGASS